MLTPAIVINKDSKYIINFEKYEDLQNSFFREVYEKATDIVVEICEFSKKINEDEKLKIKREEVTKSNSIIAFVGERGSGKSSTMLSFVSLLTEEPKRLLEFRNLDRNFFDSYYFEKLDTIDPSLFEKNDNILEIIIAQMFNKFKKSLSESNLQKDLDYNKKRSLLEKFEKTYKSIKTIEKDDKYSNEEVIEEISKLSVGANLRKCVEELISEYLDFFAKDKTHKFLTIVIDDFDLNINHALDMSELIRKYLFLPNVIILTALNYSDLFILIQQEHTKSLDNLLKYKQIDNATVKDKTFRFLEKFLPFPRRIILPRIREKEKSLYLYFDNDEEKKFLESTILNIVNPEMLEFMRRRTIYNISFEDLKQLNREITEIIYGYFPLTKTSNLFEITDKVGDKIKALLNKYNKVSKKTDSEVIVSNIKSEINKEIKRKLDFKILRFIYFKTGLNFFPSFTESNFDNLLADSIREIRSLVFFLYDMENVKVNDNDLYIKNINKFKIYFIDSWITKNLNRENRELFDSIISMDTLYINKTAKEKIYEKFIDNNSKLLSNNNSLISLIYLFRNIKKDENTIPLWFALKYYFSMNNSIFLYNEDYIELAQQLNALDIQNNKDQLVKGKNLESLSFTINRKEVYNRIRAIVSHFINIDKENLVDMIIDIHSSLILDKNEIIKKIIINLDEIHENVPIKLKSIISRTKLLISKKYSEVNISELARLKTEVINITDDKSILEIFFRLTTIYEFLSPSFKENIIKEFEKSQINKNKKIINNANSFLFIVENLLLSLTILNIKFNQEIISVFKHEKLVHEIECLLSDYKFKLGSLYKEPKKEHIVEVIEWLFLFFRFFSRDNTYYFNYREKYNFFEEFISFIQVSNDNSFLRIEDEKEFLLSDLIGLEFYIYSCKDMNKDTAINIIRAFSIKNWTNENNSMNKKLSLYRQNYSSAFPIYNLEIFDRILPNESGISSLISNQNNYGSFIELFYNTIYSQFNKIDMDVPVLSYFRNPIINPLLESELSGTLFRPLFNFVFSKETAFLKIEEESNE